MDAVIMTIMDHLEAKKMLTEADRRYINNTMALGELYSTTMEAIMYVVNKNQGGTMKLSTIQKRENLNEVYALDNKGNGNANHKYSVIQKIDLGVTPDCYAEINFQNGARKEEGSVHGVLDGDLLEIVRHRLQSFQAGPFSSRENAMALTHIEEALMWMNRRVEDRIERNVLGLNTK